MLLVYIQREYRQFCEKWDPIHVENGTTYRWSYPVIKRKRAALARKLAAPTNFTIYIEYRGLSLCWVRSSKPIRPYLVAAFNYVDVLLICLCLAAILTHGLAVVEELKITPYLAAATTLDQVSALDSAAGLAMENDINLSYILRLVIARQHLFAIVLFLCYIKCLEYIQVRRALTLHDFAALIDDRSLCMHGDQRIDMQVFSK
jgi:hypothetical protein